jgi:hypothetical protein
MNQMFVAAASRGERKTAGALARLTGSSSTLETDTPASERLNRLLGERELAMQANDADALATTDWRIDRLFEETRAARKPDESGEGAGQPQPGFDGGVRGHMSPPRRGLGQESAANLFVRAMQVSGQERRERDVDPGQTIIANI